MDETPRKPVKAWRFIRAHVGQMVIGAVLLVAVLSAVLVLLPYQRELQIARKINSLGGSIGYGYGGPSSVPQSIRDRVILFDRMYTVTLSGKAVPSDVLLDLGSLTSLKWLYLRSTQVTDAALEHLKGLTGLERLYINGTQVTDVGLATLKGLSSLEKLYLNNTQVTDTGLEHLKGLTSLKRLELNDTQVTAEGRALLRKALPNCIIIQPPEL